MKFWKISCPTFQPSCFKGYVGFIILVGIDYNKLFFSFLAAHMQQTQSLTKEETWESKPF